MSAGGVQHGRHVRAHLLGDQPPRADLPFDVQPTAADHNHRHGLAAAWHQHLPGEVSLIMIRADGLHVRPALQRLGLFFSKKRISISIYSLSLHKYRCIQYTLADAGTDCDLIMSYLQRARDNAHFCGPIRVLVG